jgi:hypothetical protein
MTLTTEAKVHPWSHQEGWHKQIHKNKHDHTQMSVELLYGTREGGKGRENDRVTS